MDIGWGQAAPALLLALSTWYLQRSQKVSTTNVKEKVEEKGNESVSEIVSLKLRVLALEDLVCKVGDSQIMIQHKLSESLERVRAELEDGKKKISALSSPQPKVTTTVQVEDENKPNLGKVILKP